MKKISMKQSIVWRNIIHNAVVTGAKMASLYSCAFLQQYMRFSPDSFVYMVN